MNTAAFIDHLTHILFDTVMPALGAWVVWLLRQMMRQDADAIEAYRSNDKSGGRE